MPKKKTETTPKAEPTVTHSELAQALVTAIEASRPQKKTPFTRTVQTPWTPKDGSKKLKLRRKMHQHGILLDEAKLSNQEIDLLNKVIPGRYMDGHVVVYRRRDRGIDIDYAIKTASQRLRLVNQFGIRNFSELLERCIEEAKNPRNPDLDTETFD